MTSPSNIPDRPPRRGSAFGKFVFSMFAIVAIGYIAWHELPSVLHRRSSDAASTKTAAGDVKLNAPASPRIARVSDLPQFVVQFSGTLQFAPGSASITGPSARILDKLVNKGDTLPGYLIEVAAFSDASDSREISASLTAARADSVIAYLMRVHAVPPARIVNATGLDTSRAFDAAPAKSKRAARTTNRRVEVKVVANRSGSTVR
jgi:outer membrane protein OmpA-like peptidoglycan-associated protein